MMDGTHSVFKTCNQALAYLDSLNLFHMDFGLERIEQALIALDLKRVPYVVVQVLGTNGKGSTSTFLTSLCEAHGYRTGLYTSPHFVTPLERIRVDSRLLSKGQWLQAANTLQRHCRNLTYFEWLTALAALLFQKNNVDVAIFEAGLGGRYDATTALPADLLCFAPIAIDHRDILGKTLLQIAADKATAIRANTPIITAPQYPMATYCLAEAAQKWGARLYQALPLPADSSLRPTLAGSYQRINAGLALTAWRILAPMLGCRDDDLNKQQQGLLEAFLPGRMQAIENTTEHPDMLLDGAHNPHGMKALIQALRHADIQPACAIFSCLADKDWRPSVMLLKRFLDGVPVFIPTLNIPRATPSEEVVRFWNSTEFRTARAVENLSNALSALRRVPAISSTRPVLITGSLYLLAEFFTLFPAALTRSR